MNPKFQLQTILKSVLLLYFIARVPSSRTLPFTLNLLASRTSYHNKINLKKVFKSNSHWMYLVIKEIITMIIVVLGCVGFFGGGVFFVCLSLVFY